METDWDAVRRRTLRVRTALAGRFRFGLLRAPSPLAPLTERELGEVEQQFGVVMPDGYRQFLRHVDSGGVGPVTMRRLVRGPGGWRWENDRETDLASLATPFPDQDSYEDLWDGLEAVEPPRSDEAAWTAWDLRAEDLHRAQTAGALYISDDGCGFHTLLVCSGVERGNVWFDRRATCDDIVPLRNPDGTHASFTDFYLDWLDAAEQALAGRWGRLYRYEIRAPIYEGRFD
ncbi:SMI1/KNR4 family protein [Micromonospora echinaurantiaca]|uniref:SMI1/KNR4 family protein n=1 Tax=Micromonospora echinaurantiaca TaxID=47857 RepID=UPI0037B7C0C2